MKFHVLTLFPEIPRVFFETSIMKRAVQEGIISYNLINIRDFAYDKHKTCDDTPYGGGAGMVMNAEPLHRALQSVLNIPPKQKKSGKKKLAQKRVVYMSPSGIKFTQKKAVEFSCLEEIVLICGRYEGIDQRIIDYWVDEEISLGDYVLSSGEAAAVVLIDAVYRLCEGVISAESLNEESYTDGLLEYPHYTRPEVFNKMAVPAVLLSGNHKKIALWRQKKRLAKTLAMRPDLIDDARKSGLLSDDEELMITELLGLNV